MSETPTRTKRVLAVALSADGQTAAWGDADALMIQRRGSAPQLLSHYPAQLTAAALSGDGRWLAAGSGDGTCKVFETATAKEVHRLDGHRGAISYIAFDSTGDQIVTASDDRTARVWAMTTGTALPPFDHPTFVKAAQFADPHHVVTACVDPDGKSIQISVWDLSTRRELSRESTPLLMSPSFFEFSGKWPIAFSRSGKLLAFGLDLQTIQMRDIGARQLSKTFRTLTSRISAVDLNPSGQSVAVASGSNIQIWSLASGYEKTLRTGYRRPVRSLTFTADGKYLVSVGEDERADMWDISSAKSTKPPNNLGKIVYGDPSRIGAVGLDGSVTLWDIKLHTIQRFKFTRHPEAPDDNTRLAVSPDGHWLATASQLWNRVEVWELPDGHNVIPIKNSGFHLMTQLQFSPDSKRLAWGESDGAVSVLTVDTKERLRLCCHQPWWVNSVAFSKDGTLLLSGGQDQSIKLWNVESSWKKSTRLITTMLGHTGSVNSVAFEPKGTFLVSGADDGTTRLWDLRTYVELIDLISLDKKPGWLVVTPQGLFDGTADGIRSVSWRYPHTNDIYPLDIFYDDYFHPGLPREVLGGKRPVPCEDIATHLRIPGVRLMNQERLIHVEVHEGKAILCLPGAADRSLFDYFEATSRGFQVPVKPENLRPLYTASCPYGLELPGKPSEIELNARRISSQKQCSVEPLPPAPECKRGSPRDAKLHVLTIAVSDYPESNTFGPLPPVVVNDAKKVEAFFQSRTPKPNDPYYGIQVWHGLYDEKATLAAIRSRFAEMAQQMRPEDIVLLLLSGHGRVFPGQEMFYYLPVDFIPNEAAETGLNTAMLVDFIRSIPARRVIVVINACQSGGALDSLVKIAETYVEVKTESSENPAAPVLNSSGIHVVTAAIPFQDALIIGGQDIFADALSQSLGVDGTELQSDLCAAELSSRVEKNVLDLVKKLPESQTLLSFSRGIDFILLTKQ